MPTSHFILEPEWVATVEPGEPVLTGNAVVVGDDRILAVLPIDAAHQKYPDATRVQRPGHLLVPGFINAHTHAAMSLMRAPHATAARDDGYRRC